MPNLLSWMLPVGLAAFVVFRVYTGIREIFWPSPPRFVVRLPGSWLSSEYPVPLRFFGKGCKEEFERYFDGRSLVKTGDIDDICEFLLGCQYQRDIDNHGVPDRWMHPTHFESVRRGDCEDFALWTWRKLIELGRPAEFMVGRWRQEGREATHAWVVFDDPSLGVCLFEPVARDRARMILPLAIAAPDYRPFASVDGGFRRRLYLGLSLWVGDMADDRKRRRQQAGGNGTQRK